MRFGGGLVPAELGMATRTVGRGLQWLGENRTREMLFEDLLGFGVLRTGMDLLRKAFYRRDDQNGAAASQDKGIHGLLNIPLGVERITRESASILTDNVLAGVVALGIGKTLDKRRGGFSGEFVNFPTLEMMRPLAQNAATEKDMTRLLADKIAGPAWQGDRQALVALIEEAADDAGVKMARLLDQTQLERVIDGQTVHLGELVRDTRALRNAVAEQAPARMRHWGEVAGRVIGKTIQTKYLKMLGLPVAVAATLAVPPLMNRMTRSVFHINGYPGETGLQKPSALPLAGGEAGDKTQLTVRQTFRSFLHARQLPQFGRMADAAGKETTTSWTLAEWKKGKHWPLLMSLAPMLFAVGLFNTGTRRLMLPKAGFLKEWRNLYDFGKTFPHTTQQQMASIFAMLITSRMMSARSGNEYRERAVDSGAGWAIWILGTPILKKWVAKLWDPALLKTVNGQQVMRTRTELEELLPKARGAVGRNIWIQAGALGATLALLGIAEPYLAMRWTQKNGARPDAGQNPALS